MFQAKIVSAVLFSILLLLATSSCSRAREQAALQESKPELALPSVQSVNRPAQPSQSEPHQAQKPTSSRVSVVPGKVSSEARTAPAPRRSNRVVFTPPRAQPRAGVEEEMAMQSEAEPELSPQRQPAQTEQVASPPPPPRPLTALLPEGTVLDIRLVEALTSEKNRMGDHFTATLDRDLEARGRILIPYKSLVTGKVVDVGQSGKVKDRSRLALTLVSIEAPEASYPIHTNTISFEAEGTKGEDAQTVGGGAGLGALIGGIIGGKKGAAIGAAVGGGAATAKVLTTKGRKIELQPERKLSFRLETDLSITLN